MECPVEIRTVSLGIYSSFSTAQAVAMSALELNLKRLQSAGFMGKYCNDIDLCRRGLITHITKNRQERPLSEYQIEALPLQDRAVRVDSSLGVFGEQNGSPNPMVSLPPKQMPPTIFKIEQDPLWAQSRIPYFRKRDDGPFRSVNEPAYATYFVMNMPEARKFAVNVVTTNKDDKKRAVTGILKQRMTPDPNLEVQTRPDLLETKVEKLTSTGSTRPQQGGGKDIEPIYQGRRHSISLN
ncbi:uncharacterized protein CC84DRAFT_1218473 [Paraphaeosphaeria sporulosa]|uniref:Uncharacterized protein n=1 Tax=Paraphaeosphaeria sporulosa TaxID=1460663 RepID=A0A177CE75_9PLEO|nr:uncharacterized protein CC84DRAFT_1218473 [Paraphaeosphaeria sporulosa]OAG05088.1 hypothetical protein CC84DRAFT_1218473 [Paraphaeosphaeria sporulosa]